jgi:hypothetical protein
MAVLRKGRSLGTTAMAAQQKRFDSDSSDAESLYGGHAGPLSSSPPRPWFPPPPTEPVREKRTRVYDAPEPVAELPPLPKPEAIPVPVVSQSPLSRLKSRPRTLLERIDGWWDLGLLERKGNGSPVARKPSMRA